MKLQLLYVDELRGFYKSKVMLFLWIGLPIISILFHFIQYETTGQSISFTVISGLVISSLAGTLAAVMLTVSIINEKSRNVYALFLIRPLKRRDIILAKFLSVYSCVAMATFIAVFFGIGIDYLSAGTFSTMALNNLGQSLAISFSLVAVSCAAGVLIGVAAPSVLVGVILVIYGGNQISVLPLVPTILNLSNATEFTIGLAALTAALILVLAIYLFERKQF